MSEEPEDNNSSFKTLNTGSNKILQGEGERVKIIKKKKVFVSFSSNVNDEDNSIENKENDSPNSNSCNINSNKGTVADNISACVRVPQVVSESENLNVLQHDHLKQHYLHWPELNPKHSELPEEEQLSPGKSENSNSVPKISRNSYAEALKLNISSDSTPDLNVEVNHQLMDVQEMNSRLNKEMNYYVGDYENPFGVIGRNVADRKESKKLSEFQTDFSCHSNEDNTFLKDALPHTPFKIDLQEVGLKLSNSVVEEDKGLTNFENCFRNEYSDQNNLRQEYSPKTDLLNVLETDNVFTKTTDRELLSPIPKLSYSDKTYIDLCAKSTNALVETHNFRYPLNNNWNGDSSYGTCIKTSRKDIQSLNQDARTDSPPERDSAYTSQVEVIPFEHNEFSSNSFLSNTLRICGKNFKSEHPVFFIPLYLGLKQDAEIQETNLIASPTHLAIESELSELWKESSQKSVDKHSKNASHPEVQELDCENKPKVQGMMEHSQIHDEIQLLLSDIVEVRASNTSESSTVNTSFSSSILTEKGFNNSTNTANHPSEHVSDACGQKINYRPSVTPNNLSSISTEATNDNLAFKSSYDMYISASNEVQQEIEEINQRISLLSETEDESDYENEQKVHGSMEDSQFCDEVQLLLNNIDEMDVSNASDSSTAITSFSSSILTEKGFNCTSVTNHLNEHVSDACAQEISDRPSVTPYNLSSILSEATNVNLDFDSSYISMRNEIQQEIQELNQRISLLSEQLLNLKF